MPTIEERVDSLESILGQFIVHTDVALRRLEREMSAFREEMKAFKDEMKAFREEMKEDAKRRDNEMKAFQDEMRAFREEMREDAKRRDNEMKAFKEEMRVFQDEMKGFRKEQDEEWKKWRKEWSNLAKKMGTLVEDLIAPALRPVLSKYFNCDVTMEGQRMFRRKAEENYEVDAIAACDDRVFMVEVRSTPRFDDIKEIVEKSRRFFEFFPEHKDKKLSVIFGSITFPEDVIKQASLNRIYVLGWREWEYMDILNFEEVKQLAAISPK